MATLFNSKIILASGIKLDKSYKHVLNYTEQQMLALVNSNKIVESSSFNFINSTGEIRVPFTYSQCLGANYIAFQNPDYNNKWFFAFIDEVVFRSVNMCELKYTIDVFSTWFNRLTIKPCFVIREHVNDDSIGAHTVEENIKTGEPICIYETKAFDTSSNFFVAIATTYDPTYCEEQVRKGKDLTGVSLYNKNFFGTQLFLFEIDTTDTGSIQASGERLIQFLVAINGDKSGDMSCVTDMYIIPKELIPQSSLSVVNFPFDRS